MVSEFGFFKKKKLYGLTLGLCTSSEENCKISCSLVLWLVSFTSSKRRSEVKGLTNKLYAYALVWNWFTCKISGSLVLWLVCFDMDLVCIIMYCQDT